MCLDFNIWNTGGEIVDIKTRTSENNQLKKDKILLVHLPYWIPLVPPMGIASLKDFIQKQREDCQVKTVDLNVEKQFKELYDRYYNVFRKYIPENRRGNFYHIGHDVLQQHMMAHINYRDETEYKKLVKILIDTIFFNDAGEEQVQEHIDIIREFYQRLENYFLELFKKEKPDVLGCTVFKGTLPAALFVYRLAKKTIPNIKTAMGGGIFISTLIQDTPDMEFFLEKTKDHVDKIIIGKGEYFLLKFLENKLPESQRVFTIKDIKEDIPKPSSTGTPDLSDFIVRNYPYVIASASKGCLHKCSFCNSSIFYGDYQPKPISQTVAEMMKFHETYGSRLFFMTDALLNPIITDLTREIIKSGRSLYVDGYFRVDEKSRDIENTLLWRQGGFYRARLGVESGSQRVLDLMGKNITVDQTRESLAGLSYAGIKPTVYFVIGHPGETEEDFQQTLNLLDDIRNDIWQAECNPFYYYSGQPAADKWAARRKLLYPENAKDMLIIPTWIVEGEPSREEMYNRVIRFVNHCKKLGIPNPYSLEEIYEADERWKKLHRNAVPPLIELMNTNGDTSFDEVKKVKKFSVAQNKQQYAGDFAF
jgi:radical SAM superfamily enzyme YgiQ (UPF0313 family)